MNLKNLFGENHGLDEKSMDFLLRAIERKNLPGFDYIEFKQSMNALSKMHLDEETAVKSAFATASTMGLNKIKLTDSVTHYKEVLMSEKKEFNTALENQIKQKVDAKKTEVGQLSQKILDHEAEIKRLQDEIASFKNTLETADEQIEDISKKIDSTRESFEMTHASIINQMEKDLEIFNKYL